MNLEDYVIQIEMTSNPEKYYSALDVFLFPSLFEGFGIALLEAQAAGCKCIASDNVPCMTNVTGKVQYLPLELDKWKAKLTDLSMDEARDATSSDNVNIIREKGFEIKESAIQLQNFYLDCV